MEGKLAVAFLSIFVEFLPLTETFHLLLRKYDLTKLIFLKIIKDTKGMFHSLFKVVFRKLLSMVNILSLVFRSMKGDFPRFPPVRPKEDVLSPFNVCKQTHHKLPVF